MLKMLLLILIALAPKHALSGRVQSNYNKFNTITGVPAATTTYTTATAVSSSPTFASSWQQNQYIYETTSKQQQQQQQQQVPLTYYNYNGSSNSGNYHAGAQDMRVMKPYFLAFSNQGGSKVASSKMHKNQQAIEKSSRSSNKNNSNISKRNTHDSFINNHNNPGGINNYNNFNNKNNNSTRINSSHSQSQDNKHYAEHTTNTPTTNNVNNANNIVAQPQHATLFGWHNIESKIIATIRGMDNAKGQNANDKSDDEKRADTERDEAMVVGSVVNDINSLEDTQFNEILLPLRNILDKVTQFCVTLKRVINDDKEDLASSQLFTASESDEVFANTATTKREHAASILQPGDTAQLLAEVQGQQGEPSTPPTTHSTNTQQSQPNEMVWPPQLTAPRSTAVTASVRGATTNANTTQQTAKSFTSTSLGIGRGKKLKKKLKKLILPLLLAYKLKFITLLPLLIGGLVLLVGSTGMAGFFFALFLTVITLKGGVSKSIVIKKDW